MEYILRVLIFHINIFRAFMRGKYIEKSERGELTISLGRKIFLISILSLYFHRSKQYDKCYSFGFPR